MGQLVRQREHLRRLGIGAVDEHERGKIVRQGETSKFLRVELAAVVTAHHPAHHDENPRGVCLLDEAPQSVCPGRQLASLIEVEPERPSDARLTFVHSSVGPRGTDERQRSFRS